MTVWQTFIGMIIKPLYTFQHLQNDDRAARKGLWVLLLVLGTYTFILSIFITHDYPAMAPSILPISVEDLYRYQVWYQGPLFIVATLVLTGLLVLLAKMKGQAAGFTVVFARVRLATAVPFALTTMAVELVIAILVLVGVFQPLEILGWLAGEGAWFANAYQLVGVLWIIGLLALTARLTLGVRWWLAIILGVVLAVIYGIPIGLFIR
ncbi:MAG: hypothetical protein H6657_24365 [Ardenticatenaceae bacterium]|nr:hypothetical protein [Ardenticatenaceae bacterium]